MSNWDYRVRGYAGHHHRQYPHGVLIKETTHKGEASLEMEVHAWQSRMKRDDASRCEIIYLVPPFGTDILLDPEAKYVPRRP
jgi:hypothetical protein